MFSTRFRNAALAFAGALVVATTLLTGVAAAAPVPAANTASAETAAAQPKADGPVNDIRVKLLDRRGTGKLGEGAWVKFEAKNVGNQQMTFELDTSWSKQNPFVDTYHPTRYEQVMTLNPGEAKTVELNCTPGTSNFRCYYFLAIAHSFDKADSNFNNNGADWAP